MTRLTCVEPSCDYQGEMLRATGFARLRGLWARPACPNGHMLLEWQEAMDQLREPPPFGRFVGVDYRQRTIVHDKPGDN